MFGWYTYFIYVYSNNKWIYLIQTQWNLVNYKHFIVMSISMALKSLWPCIAWLKKKRYDVGAFTFELMIFAFLFFFFFFSFFSVTKKSTNYRFCCCGFQGEDLYFIYYCVLNLIYWCKSSLMGFMKLFHFHKMPFVGWCIIMVMGFMKLFHFIKCPLTRFSISHAVLHAFFFVDLGNIFIFFELAIGRILHLPCSFACISSCEFMKMFLFS